MNLKDELLLIVDSLRNACVDYALCGGIAVAMHGFPRATRDIDMLIREQDLDHAQQALAKVGYDLTSGIIPFDTSQPTARRIFRVTKVEGGDFLTLDLILVSPFLEDVWLSREQHVVDGRLLQVISRAGLIKMKRVAGRPQDLADLAQLGDDGSEQ
jgi:hypothetical protein